MIKWLLNLIHPSPKNKRPTVTDLTGKTWPQAVKAMKAGHRVTNKAWPDDDWLIMRNDAIWRVSGIHGEWPYSIDVWVKYGSGNTWCILPE